MAATEAGSDGSKHPMTLFYKALSSRLSKAISGQALVSLFHFSINLFLLRLFSPHDYGVFALSFVLAMVAAAVNNALISTPLSIYTPVIKVALERREQEAVFNALNGLFIISVLILGALSLLSFDATAIPVTLFICSYATRQYTRSFAYARLRAEIPARADALYAAVGLLGCAVSITLYDNTALPAVLISLAAANTAASLLEITQLRDAWRLPDQLRALGSYRRLWPQTRWALIGAVTTLLMGQAHAIIISGSLGASAFAPLAAGGVLFGPVRVVLTTWQNLSKPQMAIDLDAQRYSQVMRHIKHTTVVMCAALCAVAAALWLLWPWVHGLLYSEKYSAEPMALIVSLWTVITLFVTLNSPASAALQALADFKVLALASVYGALLSTATVVTLLLLQDPASTLFGALIAEVFMTAYLLLKLNDRMQLRT